MRPEITVFGEILWDIFGEDKTIGGAPFNFAAHAVQLGAETKLISAVGKDQLGNDALGECARMGVSCDFIARTDWPTGYCAVTLDDGIPSYDLVTDVAYDHIPFPERIRNDHRGTDVIYFGTLAQRGAESRKTLHELLKILRTYKGAGSEGKVPEVFFDINIRQHYYSEEIINESMNAATILKVSREEIGVFGIPGSPGKICAELAASFPSLKMIIVTLDSDGAFIYICDSKETVHAPKPDCSVVSTVGAGDSFSAGFLMSWLEGLSLEECLRRASLLAGYVVTQPGAVPEYPAELKMALGI